MKLVFEEKTASGLTMPDEFTVSSKNTPGFWTNHIRSLLHSMEKENALKDFPMMLSSQINPDLRKDIVETFMYELSKDDIQYIMNKFKKYL